MKSVIVNAVRNVRKFSDNIIVFGQTLNKYTRRKHPVVDYGMFFVVALL
jgi:hypothetical protein